MKQPRAGAMRESVVIERRAATDDGYGNTVSGDFERYWPATGGIAAQVIPLRGGEAVQAARLSGSVTFEVIVRNAAGLADMTTADRVRDLRSGAIYNIRAIVNPDQRGAWLHMTCERGVAT